MGRSGFFVIALCLWIESSESIRGVAKTATEEAQLTATLPQPLPQAEIPKDAPASPPRLAQSQNQAAAKDGQPGFFDKLKHVGGAIMDSFGKVTSAIGQALGLSNEKLIISADDERCAMCQFFVEFIEAVEITYSSGGSAGFAGYGTPVPVDVLLQQQDVKSPQDATQAKSTQTEASHFVPGSSQSQGQEPGKPSNIPGSTTIALLDNSSERKRLHSAAQPPMARDVSQDNVGEQLRLAGWGERTGETLLTTNGLNMVDDRSENYVIGPKERRLELVGSLSRDMRLLPSVGNPNTNAAAQERRAQWVRMDTETYYVLYNLCASRVPANFLIYCKVIVSEYVHITAALHWGDKPATICIRMGECNSNSYMQKLPHSLTTGISVPPPIIGKGIGYVETEANIGVPTEKKQ